MCPSIRDLITSCRILDYWLKSNAHKHYRQIDECFRNRKVGYVSPMQVYCLPWNAQELTWSFFARLENRKKKPPQLHLRLLSMESKGRGWFTVRNHFQQSHLNFVRPRIGLMVACTSVGHSLNRLQVLFSDFLCWFVSRLNVYFPNNITYKFLYPLTTSN